MERYHTEEDEIEQRLQDYYGSERQELRAPADLWAKLEPRLGEQRSRLGLLWQTIASAIRPTELPVLTAAAVFVVLVLGVGLWFLIGGVPGGPAAPTPTPTPTPAPTPTPTPSPMPTPLPPIELKIYPQDSIVVPQGGSGTVTIEVTSESEEALDLLASSEGLPQGVEVEFRPEAFTLNPQETVEVQAIITVSPTAPPPKWPRWTPPPEGVPAPLSPPITEAAYYRVKLFFKWPGVYGFGTDIKLTFEEPSPPPPGMVTLAEASGVVDFIIQIPLYMPEGTEPPFIGLTVTPEEPHAVTIHYSTFEVTQVPEPGVTGPPPDAVGERTTIHNKQALIGENRVDWWAYDIHYSVVSDQVPVEEQIMIAESMLVLRPGTGSWLFKTPETPTPTTPTLTPTLTPMPAPILLQITAAAAKASYLVGELIVIQFSFENVSSEPLTIDPFRPRFEITGGLPPEVVRAFPAGEETLSVRPGGTAFSTFTWDQRDADGEQVSPGYYYFRVDVRFDGSRAGTSIKLQIRFPSVGEVKIYSDTEKTISISVDQEFAIALYSNPRLGTRWYETHDENKLALLESTFLLPDKLRPLAGTRYFRFKALKTGKTEITLTYRHEATGPIREQKVFNVDIK